MNSFEEYYISSLIVEQTIKNTEIFLNQEFPVYETTNIIKDVIKEAERKFSFDLSFVFKFGGGIGALMGPFARFYEGSGFQLTEKESILLLISMIGMLQKKDLKKFKTLFNYSTKGKQKLRKMCITAVHILKGIMKRLQSYQNIIAYSAMLIPILQAMEQIAGGSLTSINATTIKNIILGMSINIAMYTGTGVVKKLFNTIKEKL